jgi:hypothetical protein
MLRIEEIQCLSEEPKKLSWVNGRFHCLQFDASSGETVGYYESGKLQFRYPTVEGRLHGTGRLWYEDGTLKCEEHYNRGALHGPAHYWYPNGVMERELNYQQGFLQGVRRDWYAMLPGVQKIKQRCVYVRDVLHGPMTSWYPDGKVRVELNFERGRRHGLHKFYNEEGTLRLKEIYVRGVRVPMKKYEKLLAGNCPASEILEIQNLAVRRIFVEEFGYARILAQMPHEVIAKDGEQELVRIDWSTREEPISLVRVKCPSTGAFYALRVPPSMKTVAQAVAWTFGMHEKKYVPEKET